jgi:hypothetical protein
MAQQPTPSTDPLSSNSDEWGAAQGSRDERRYEDESNNVGHNDFNHHYHADDGTQHEQYRN